MIRCRVRDGAAWRRSRAKVSSAPNHRARNSPAIPYRLRMDEFSFNGAIHAAINHLETKLLSLPVIAIQAQHFADGAASWLTLDVDDEVDGFADLSLNVLIRRLLVASHDEISEAAKGLDCRVGMDRGQCPGVAGLKRV